MILFELLTVETCDERTIPAVAHATFELKRLAFHKNGTSTLTSTSTELQNFTIPDHVNVTYTCDEGYRLRDVNSNVIGCKYVTTPRKGSQNVTAKAVWTSTDEIICGKVQLPMVTEKGNWKISVTMDNLKMVTEKYQLLMAKKAI